MFTYGLWAFGAFAIGVGVLPVLATLFWLLGARLRTLDERVLLGTVTGSVIAFGLYTAAKASFLSTTLAVRVEERNLIYLAPLAFVVTARWATVGRTRLVPGAIAVAAVAYLLATTPYHSNEHFYSDAPGLAILQWMNRPGASRRPTSVTCCSGSSSARSSRRPPGSSCVAAGDSPHPWSAWSPEPCSQRSW